MSEFVIPHALKKTLFYNMVSKAKIGKNNFQKGRFWGGGLLKICFGDFDRGI